MSHSFLAAAAATSRFRALTTAGAGLALLLALGTPLLAHDYKAGDLAIGHPWSRATPEGAKVAAGYATIRNDGSEPDRLIGVSAAIAGKGEVHEMSVDAKGVMTMRPVDGVEIPAGATVELKPGGFHMMFMELNQPAREGDRFKGTMTFEKAGTVEVEFAVDAIGKKPAGDAGGHDGHEGHGG